MKPLRIFISSPGDVAEERDRARQVIEGLRRRYAGRAFLKPVLWEDLPLQAGLSFQEGIDLVLSAEHGIDVAVFILWSRFGSLQDGSKHRSGTEREFDLMMAAREQSGGTRPAALVYARSDDVSFGERLRGRSTVEQQELLGQKAMVEQFIAEKFKDTSTGRNIRAYHQFDRPVTFSQRLRTHLTELLDELVGAEVADTVWDIERQGPPFMGLEAFQPCHADVFFGREAETMEARHVLREQARQGCAFLLLSGSSGSGKSSLARAGVLPGIVENELDEQVAAWRTVVTTPLELGADPLAGLVRCIVADDVLPELRGDAEAMEDLLEGLRRDPALTIRLRMKDAFSRASAPAGGGVRLLLVVDQMEELFTSAALAETARTEFLHALEAMARSGQVWVLATVRSDFSAQVQAQPTLVRMTEGRGVLPLLPPGADALRRLIEQPARMAGLSFEQRAGQSLADRILRDASAHAELLPLVEFLLRELHEQRGEGGLLLWEVYERLGGVEGALAKRAEDVFHAQPAAAQESLGTVLKALVTIGQERGDGSGDEMVRQRVSLAELEREAGAAELVRALIRERLLVAENDAVTGAATVTIAHESLLRVWPRALAWAANNRELLRTRARVASRLRDGSPLLDGDPLLDAARAGLAADPASFRPEQREFIEQCARDASLARARGLRNRRRVMAALAVLALASICAAVFAFHKSGEESKARATAQTERQRSDDMLKQVQLQRAEDFFDKGDSSAGIAYLAAVLRRYPADTITASRLLSALRDRSHSRILHGPWTEPEAKLIGWDATGASLLIHSKRGILRWRLSERAPDEKPLIAPEIERVDGKVEILGYPVFSPDRSKLLVFHDWAKARLHDSKTGAPVGPMLVNTNAWVGFSSNESAGPQAAFSADGRWVFPMMAGGPNRIYDTASASLVGRFLSTPAHPTAAAFHPDGKLMAVGCMDGTVQIREANGGDWKVLQSWKSADVFIRKIEFSKGHLFVDSPDRLWIHSINGNSVNEQGATVGNVACFAVSPNGKRLLAGNVGTAHSVTLYSLESSIGRLGAPIHCDAYPRQVAFLPDANRFSVTTNTDSQVLSFDGDLLQKSRTFANAPQGDGYGNRGVKLAPDSDVIAIGHRDGTIQTWSLSPRRSLPAIYPMIGGDSIAALHPSGESLATANDRGGHIAVWGMDSAKPLAPAFRAAPKNGRIGIVAFRPGSDEIWSGGTASTPPSRQAILGWHWPTGKRLRDRIRSDGHIGPLKFSQDGRRMYVAGDKMQIVAFPEMKEIKGPWSGTVNRYETDTYSSATGGFLLIREATSVTRFSFETGEPQSPYVIGEWAALGISEDGETFVARNLDNSFQFWDAKTGARLGPVIRSPAAIERIRAHSKTSLAVVACEDRGIRLWNYFTGESLGAVMPHADIITAIAISPDGRTLASACFDGTLRFWDLPSGRPLSEAAPFVGSVLDSLEWHPDGKRVIAAGRVPVQIWPLLRTDVDAPGWLVDWAEAVGGQRLDEKGELHSLPLDAEREFEKRAASIAGDDAYPRALRWYYEPSDDRALSPGHTLTVRDWATSLARVGELSKDSLARLQSPESPAACSSYLWDGDTKGDGLIFPAITRAYFDRVAERAKRSPADAGLGWLIEAQLHLSQAREKVPEACKEALKAGLEEPWKTRCHVLLVRSLSDAGDARRPELDTLLAQPEVLQSLHTHGVNLREAGSMEKAADSLGRALAFREKALGPDHADTLITRHAMVEILKHKKDDAGALEVLRLVSEARGRTLGPEHEDTIAVLAEYTEALLAIPDRDTAEPHVRRLMAWFGKQHGPDDAHTIHWTKKLADLLRGKGRHAEAGPIFQSLIEARTRADKNDTRTILHAVHEYAGSLTAQRKPAEAEVQFRRAMEGREKLHGRDHVDTLWSISGLADALNNLKRETEALALFLETYETRTRVFGPRHPDTLLSATHYGELLVKLGKDDDTARRVLTEAHQALLETSGENHLLTTLTKRTKAALEKLDQKAAAPKPEGEAR